jgi:hypothetical protein
MRTRHLGAEQPDVAEDADRIGRSLRHLVRIRQTGVLIEQQGVQFVPGEPDHAQIKAILASSLQLKLQQIEVPAGQQRQLVVRNDISLTLRFS